MRQLEEKDICGIDFEAFRGMSLCLSVWLCLSDLTQYVVVVSLYRASLTVVLISCWTVLSAS